MSVHVQATKRTKLHVFEQCTLCENGLRSFAPSNMLTHHPDISLVRRGLSFPIIGGNVAG